VTTPAGHDITDAFMLAWQADANYHLAQDVSMKLTVLLSDSFELLILVAFHPTNHAASDPVARVTARLCL